MGTYKEVDGNLILMGKQGSFDVIGHGVNCFCRMKRGIAPQMAEAFGCDKFEMESYESIEKLGNIDFQTLVLGANSIWSLSDVNNKLSEPELTVVNCYTQYQWGTELKPFDYEAFILCMRKMNHIFKGKHIGLPKIGSHLAGGDWERIKLIIQKELKDCKVTIVIYGE